MLRGHRGAQRTSGVAIAGCRVMNTSGTQHRAISAPQPATTQRSTPECSRPSGNDSTT
jgi:hypothetical protein